MQSLPLQAARAADAVINDPRVTVQWPLMKPEAWPMAGTPEQGAAAAAAQHYIQPALQAVEIPTAAAAQGVAASDVEQGGAPASAPAAAGPQAAAPAAAPASTDAAAPAATMPQDADPETETALEYLYDDTA